MEQQCRRGGLAFFFPKTIGLLFEPVPTLLLKPHRLEFPAHRNHDSTKYSCNTPVSNLIHLLCVTRRKHAYKKLHKFLLHLTLQVERLKFSREEKGDMKQSHASACTHVRVRATAVLREACLLEAKFRTHFLC